MKTLLRLGPKDHGRPLTLDEFTSAPYQEGYHYELIEGKLYVSPLPNLPHGFIERWLGRELDAYSNAHPEVINFVYGKTRVFVPDHPEVTAPEPDLAAYQDFPVDREPDELRWEDVSPVLVVEILSEDDPDKDLVRNVKLYLMVPSIREYWILDGRQSASTPSMLVFRRRGERWQKAIQIAHGDTYTTRILPGFTLTLAPHM
jgi:Uma2 family endonuclease